MLRLFSSIAGILLFSKVSSKIYNVPEWVSWGGFASPFQADARDGRPCTYPGRLLLHPTGKDKLWANSQLVKTGRTADAEMPHSRDMLQVEDVSEDALPSTVDDDNAVVQGAMKYQQVGFVNSAMQIC